MSSIIISCSLDNEEMFLPVAEIKIYTPLANAFVHPDDIIYIDGVAILKTGVHGLNWLLENREKLICIFNISINTAIAL